MGAKNNSGMYKGTIGAKKFPLSDNPLTFNNEQQMMGYSEGRRKESKKQRIIEFGTIKEEFFQTSLFNVLTAKLLREIIESDKTVEFTFMQNRYLISNSLNPLSRTIFLFEKLQDFRSCESLLKNAKIGKLKLVDILNQVTHIDIY